MTESRLTFRAVLDDKLSGPLKKARQSVEDTTQSVEEHGKQSTKAYDKAGKAAEKTAATTTKSASRISQALTGATGSATKLEQGLLGAERRAGGSLSALALDAERSGNRIERALAGAGEQGGTKMVSNLKSAGNRFVGEARKIGKEAGTKLADELQGAIDKISSSPIAAAAGGFGLGAGVAGSMNADAAARRAAAAAGVDAGAVRKGADEIYYSGQGESQQAVAGAYADASATFDVEPGERLEGLVRGNLSLSDIFGVDPASMTMTARITADMDGSSIEEAQQVIAQALQGAPADAAPEIIEALNEYGALMEGSGVSGASFADLLNQASQSGSMAVDKEADAIKEFMIRGTDLGDTAAGDALSAAGFDHADVSARIQSGDIGVQGDVARAIMEMDPADRSEAAYSIWGAPMEDLGPAQLEEQLGEFANLDYNAEIDPAPYNEIRGAMEGSQAKDWTQLVRAAEQSFTKIGDSLAPVLIPLFNAMTWAAPAIGPIAAALATMSGLKMARKGFDAIKGVFGLFTGGKGTKIAGGLRGAAAGTGLLSGAMTALRVAMSAHPLLLLVSVAWAAYEAFSYLYENVGWFKTAMDGLGSGISGVFGFFDDLGDKIDSLVEEKLPALHALLNFGDGSTDEDARDFGTKVGDAGAYFGDQLNLPDFSGGARSERAQRHYENLDAVQGRGYFNGGYTGDIGRHEVAGVVHGQEFVVPADATAAIARTHPDALPALRRGELPSGNVTISPTIRIDGAGDPAAVARQVEAAIARIARDAETSYGNYAVRGAR